MNILLLVLQIVLAISLMIVILVQNRGTGFGRSLSSSSSFTRRGLERIVFRMTFILTGLFIIVSVLQLIF